ncbi:hypothetical protein ACFV1L_22880 [Kitasatospora sp. NPDC059646]|uniref:hypothetical protein n=1 Tax=Kitasatospora sp. NPDC059646 TaxID=3346893 RepID=UPI0036A85C7E
MPDDVTPLRTTPRLGTFNGFGRTMLGRTRVDADGACFATRWFTAAMLPIVPLGRYYLKVGETVDVAGRGGASTSTTQYLFLGEARLRPSEILRTYLFFWVLVPLLTALPVTLFALNADAFSHEHPLLFILLLLGIPVVGIIVLAWLLVLHEKFLAPLREPRWTGAARQRRTT